MDQSFVERIRETHRDPRNIAMHAAGWLFVLGGLRRLVRGQLGGAIVRSGIGVALMGLGHVVEGNEPYGVMRERLRERRGEPSPL